MLTHDLRYIEFVRDVLISVHENIHELNERKNFADADERSYIEGKLLAYREMLAILQASAAAFGLPKEELGL